jgi:hypothetical protein
LTFLDIVTNLEMGGRTTKDTKSTKKTKEITSLIYKHH